MIRWHWLETPAGAFEAPAAIPQDAGWRDCTVPKTAAALLAEAGLFDAKAPRRLDQSDFWYRAQADLAGPHDLQCAMLAGEAEVWWRGELIARHESMFVPLCAPLAEGSGWLALRIRGGLKPPRMARPRWRPAMIPEAAMRARRQTLLGHMPGWCPEIQSVGPVTGLSLAPAARMGWRIAQLAADWRDGAAWLSVTLEPQGHFPRKAACAGVELPFREVSGGLLVAEGRIAAAAAWMPHTHGPPALHPLFIDQFAYGCIGFRRISARPEGFGLAVNGVPLFARGVCWTPLDLVSLNPSAGEYDAALTRIRDAGMNMVRVSGTTLYEHADFFAACDRLGLLVWQDFMFANFDYPAAEPAWREEVEAEARHFLERTRHHPCLAVLCGGSEVRQQAEMQGADWPPGEPLFEGLLAEIAGAERPDALYVPNTPWGGAPCFSPSAGVTHYYGVGAYMRPFEDIRRAGVRFAAECLAVANVPAMFDLSPSLARQPMDAAWKQGTPRDLGASWDFDDVRDHYIGALYRADSARLRREDPGRYLDLGRAVSCDLAEALFSEWRRPGSGCAGALVWQLRDLMPGAGWGLWSEDGPEKPVWRALARLLQPVGLFLTDEGLDGLGIHLVNETAKPLQALLSLRALRHGGGVVAEAEREVTLAPRGAITLRSPELFGRFFDSSYAYRFGPLSHEVTAATLTAPDGRHLGVACHFPDCSLAPSDPDFQAEVTPQGADFLIRLSARRFAQYVHFESPTHRPDDDWFHLPPGVTRQIRLIRRAGCRMPPAASIAALNAPAHLILPLEAEAFA